MLCYIVINRKIFLSSSQVVPLKFDSMVDIKDVLMEHADSHKLELNEIPRHSDLKQVSVHKCALLL